MMTGLSRRAFVSGLVALPVAAQARGLEAFAGREDFVWAQVLGTSFEAGAIVKAGGRYYVKDGGSAIPDLPGWSGLGQNGALTFEHFGAVADGVTDDAEAVDAAIAAGVRISGGGRTYGVAGKVALRSGTRLEDVIFRQLRPGEFENVTLSAINVDKLFLRRVTVDRNGDGRNGGHTDDANRSWAINRAHGILIEGGTGHRLEDLEVFGNDSGTGIRFRGLDGSSAIVNPYVHHIHCERNEIPDDVIQGIGFERCRDLTVSCRVHDLTVRAGDGPVSTRANRAIAVGACTELTIQRCEIENVGQAIDFTGSDGNIRCRAIENRIVQPYSVGVKFANSAVECVALNNWVYRPGRNAIIVSGASEKNLPNLTENCLVEGNVGIDVGYGGNFGGRAHGVIVERQPENRNFPRGTVVRNNVMYDTQENPTMLYGAYCDSEPLPGDAPNLTCGNVSVGHVKGAETGFAGQCSG